MANDDDSEHYQITDEQDQPDEREQLITVEAAVVDEAGEHFRSL